MGVVTAGMVVLVRDSRHGDWAGTVVLTGLPDSPVVVVVLDPLDGVRWRRGQWLWCHGGVCGPCAGRGGHGDVCC